MKILILILTLILSGCCTSKIQKSSDIIKEVKRILELSNAGGFEFYGKERKIVCTKEAPEWSKCSCSPPPCMCINKPYLDSDMIIVCKEQEVK